MIYAQKIFLDVKCFIALHNQSEVAYTTDWLWSASLDTRHVQHILNFKFQTSGSEHSVLVMLHRSKIQRSKLVYPTVLSMPLLPLVSFGRFSPLVSCPTLQLHFLFLFCASCNHCPLSTFALLTFPFLRVPLSISVHLVILCDFLPVSVWRVFSCPFFSNVTLRFCKPLYLSANSTPLNTTCSAWCLLWGPTLCKYYWPKHNLF